MYLILAGLIACGFLGLLLFNNRNMKTYRHFMKRMKKLKKSIDFFNATQTYANQNVVIAINEEEKKLCISTIKSGNPVPLVYEYSDIISCEVIENVIDPSASSKVSGKNIASIMAESVGQVTGDKESEDRVNRIDLKISFNDAQTPFVLANFLFWEVGKDSDEYKKASESASSWHGIIDDAIKIGKRNELNHNSQ